LRRLLLSLALFAAFLGLLVHPKSLPGPVMRDFEAYYAAGETWRYHGDPYGRDVWRVERRVPGVVASRDELLPFVGPPFGLPLWDGLASLPWSAATTVWGIVLAAAFATIVFGSLRLAGGSFDALDGFAVLALGAGFGPLTSALALGQVAAPSCAAIVAVPLLLRTRTAFAATVGTLVAALQPNLAIVLATQFGTTRRATIAFAFAAAIALGGSWLALSDLGGIAHYLDVLAGHAGAERFIAIQLTPAAIARSFGAAPRFAVTLGILVACLALVLAAGQLLSQRYDAVGRLALASAGLPFVLPFAHEHDLAILFFPALLVLRRARGTAWVLGAIGALAVAVDWLGLAQRAGSVAQPLFLCLGAAFAVAVLAREPLRPYHFAPLAVALATAAMAALTAGHPLPSWPYGLPLGFTAPPQLTAPVVWHAEQVLSGVARLDPVWGALRALSLSGCALVWIAGAVALADPGSAVTDSALRPNSVPSPTPLEPQAATHSSA